MRSCDAFVVCRIAGTWGLLLLTATMLQAVWVYGGLWGFAPSLLWAWALLTALSGYHWLRAQLSA